MNLWEFPWMEIAVSTTALAAVVCPFLRDIDRSYRFALACTAATTICTTLAWVAHSGHGVVTPDRTLLGAPFQSVDRISAPLASITALLYFLTTLATGRTKMGRFSVSWSLLSETIHLTAFGCMDSWALVCLLAVGTIPPYVILRKRGKPTRVYTLHMSVFVCLLIVGQALVFSHGEDSTISGWAFAPLLAAVLIRNGIVPFHCWITDWFENASFGSALLFVAPLTGVYAAVRLVLPVAPDWALESIGIVSLITAVYAACMATIQRETRRFFAYLFLSHASLVLVGMELHTPISLTGALSLWLSVMLAVSGLGLTLRALEARFGSMSLIRFHGYYDQSPPLAICFLLTGLASVGFPGTIGFIAAEMLVDGAVETSLFLGIGVVVAAAMNGIAIVRAYLLLFTGTRHESSINLGITARERFAVLTLTVLILTAGLWPQPGISTRYKAAKSILGRTGEMQTPESELEHSPHRSHP